MFKAVYQMRPSFRFIPQTLTHSTIPFPSFSFANLQSRHKHDDSSTDEFNKHPDTPPRLFVVQPRFRPDSILKIKLDEALNLANSLEQQRDGYYGTRFSDKELPPHIVVQNPAYRSIRADTLFGPGTVDNIKCHLNAEDSKGGVDAVFVNGVLTGIQQRNLERAWGKAVLDRVGLIIEIFHAHAQTKEAKLQAELAALMYKRTRLVRIRGSDGRYTFGASGEAEVVSAYKLLNSAATARRLVTGYNRMKALRLLFPKTKKHPPAKKPSFNPIFIDQTQFISLIHASKTIKHLQQIHAQIILHQQFSNSRIITQLISSSSFQNNFINYALSIFRHSKNPNLFLFNSLIRALADNSYYMSSISYFVVMLRSNIRPNSLTLPFVLKSTAALQEGWLGMEIHTEILKLGLLCDRLVLLYLVDMYAKVGLLESAYHLFDESSEWGNEARSTLLWNVLINGYCKVGKWSKAMELFEVMPEKYSSTWSSLINGLMKAGEIDRALELWHSVEERDVVSWTTMIHGFSQNWHHEKALSMFFEMLEDGVKPNDQTVVCALLACAKAGAIETGSKIHDYILTNGFTLKKGIMAALIDMYAKCGLIENASRVFDMTEDKDLRTWSVMIWGCAINGYLEKALQCFNKMKSTGIKPDGVVFLAIITACSHAGNVNQGLQFFDKMKHDYSIEPTMKHYTVMVDLYGRAGRLNEALRFIKNMSIDPDFVVWGALFSACRAHKNIQMAEYASERLLELEPKHPGGYVFLSNVYAGVGRWQDVDRVRTKMKLKGVAKDPGWSYIEIQGEVTSFVAGDHVHVRSDEIHLKLDEIVKSAREQGYMPETEWVLHNIEEEEKEDALGSHSEKLALAFALISCTFSNEVIRIVKNLKICGDCHSLMKYASKMTQRDIVVRDIKRFHHFKDGICSCQDYW